MNSLLVTLSLNEEKLICLHIVKWFQVSLFMVCTQVKWFQILLFNINNYLHHHHVTPSGRISLTLSRQPSLSSIATGRSLGLHPVSTQSCMQVRAGCPAFARPCEGFHKSTSLISSSLLLQQCPACLVRLILIVLVIGGRWPYSSCVVGCCLQDLFNIARSIIHSFAYS